MIAGEATVGFSVGRLVARGVFWTDARLGENLCELGRLEGCLVVCLCGIAVLCKLGALVPCEVDAIGCRVATVTGWVVPREVNAIG